MKPLHLISRTLGQRFLRPQQEKHPRQAGKLAALWLALGPCFCATLLWAQPQPTPPATPTRNQPEPALMDSAGPVVLAAPSAEAVQQRAELEIRAKEKGERPVLKIEPFRPSESVKKNAAPLRLFRPSAPNPVSRPAAPDFAETPRARELKTQLHRETASAIDAERLRHLAKQAPHSPEFRAMLESIRKAGDPLLRAQHSQAGAKAAQAKPSGPVIPDAKSLSSIVPRKVPLDPLPITAPATNNIECERIARIGELRGQAAAAQSPDERERLKLTLAGYQVGQGDWQSARAIYEELAATSNDPAVLEAVRRNLLVVNHKLAALAETDPARKQNLELDLANLHRDLGHEQAAKRIVRALAKDASDEAVRKQAVRFLESEPKPMRLPAPPALNSAARGAANGGAR